MGRCPWFERILGLAAPAFAMPQDEVDSSWICNKRDNAHARPAGAKERISFEDLLDQASPGAAGFPGEIGIILFGMYCSRRPGALAIGGGHGDSGAVGVSTVKPLAMASRIRDMRGDAVNLRIPVKLSA
jgi:hypothetical protein